jgi:hypothetical protein
MKRTTAAASTAAELGARAERCWAYVDESI